MKQKKISFWLFICLFTISAHSQNLKNFKLGVEFGSNTISGEMNKIWSVRQDVGSYSYYSDYSNGTVIASSNFYYVGIKPEISLLDNRLGVMTGLRLTRINSNLGKSGYSINDFFYLRYATSTSRTDYARVKYIDENNDYIGIPLEVRVYPLYFDSWGAYLKIGYELNFNLHSETNMYFVNEEMESSQQEILDAVGAQHSSTFSTLYSAVGIRLGRPGKINYNLEVVLPSFILSKNNSSIITPEIFSGVQFMVQFPLGKKSDKVVINRNNIQ